MGGRRARALIALVLATAVAALLGGPVPAQTVRIGGAPVPRILPPAHLVGRAPTPLDPALVPRLLHGRNLLENGMLDSARIVLEGVLAAAPHHPAVLVELAQVHAERQAWGDLERLATRERAATHDSTLLASELAQALERQARPAAAAQVAVEAWVASPLEGAWALGTVARLGGSAGRPVRDALRRAVLARPERADLARGLARLDWAAGDTRAVLRGLAAADQAGARPPARWAFAEDLLRGGGTAHDSAGAVDVALDLVGDRGAELTYRMLSAQRAWEVSQALGQARADAPRIAHALADQPPERWDSAFLVTVARALREGGHTAEARTLLAPHGDQPQAPGVTLERALADLRDGPPERALPGLHAGALASSEAAWRYAEALFFAGQSDSAKSWYQRVAEDAASPFAGAAFDRLFLIEDAAPPTALPSFGQLAYEEWRGDPRRASAIADSLVRVLPRGALWAQAALRAATLRDALGDIPGALAPLRAVADSLPGDRLAPLARQRLGDLYLERIHDEAQALAQYEECLARYPKAWNAPEVRRRVETLRRERRF